MKLFFFLIVFTISTAAQLDTTISSLDFIRNKFYEAVENEDAVDTLELFLTNNYGRNYSDIDPIITAYFGAIEALKGKHAFFPFTKLSYVNSSQEILEKAVERSPNNLEIRFLRFSILHYIPAILGYSAERKKDAGIIYQLLLKQDYSQLGKDIQKNILSFMIESERLNDEQVHELRKLEASFALK